MKKRNLLVAALLGTTVLGMTTVVNAEETQDYVPGEVLVLYEKGAFDQAEISLCEEAESEEIVILSEKEEEAIALVELTGDTSVEKAIEEYSQMDGVLAVSPNYILTLYEDEYPVDDSAYSLQTYLDQVSAQEAWDYMAEVPHEKVRVAVLDTGADIAHPDLENMINLELSKEILDTDGTLGALQGDDYQLGEYSSNGEGHGTHVCGVIAAEANNAQGVSGVASCYDNSVVELVVVDIFSKEKTTSMSYLINGLEYAAEQDVDVINLSLGVDKAKLEDDTILQSLCDDLEEKNVTLVAAAGNSGINDEGVVSEVPCDYDSVIGVVSVDADNVKAESSNYGSMKDIASPGVKIYSTIKNSTYAYKSGTSMASPTVTATVAMMYSVNPDITPAEVKDILKNTASELTDEQIANIGLVNCENAVKAANGETIIEPDEPDEPVVEPDIELPFTDVAEGTWYYEYVEGVYKNGFMTGKDETTFAPGDILNRAEFATILYRIEGEPEVESAEGVFPDVAAGEWYSDAVAWANQNGIIKGYDDGKFGPADNITREQMVTVMYRYAKSEGYDVSQQADLDQFEDEEKISSFALEAAGWAVANEIVSGQGDGALFDPRGTAVRAECAAIVMRFYNLYVGE